MERRLRGEKLMKYMLRSLKLKDSEGILEWMHDPKINLWYTGKIKNATLNSVINFKIGRAHV